ncbi:hypothetical protein CAPI_06270 [Corynebacterium capitovis DSM 44611]|uniref:DUF262 domain-containing protein n=1 Tax=Corynebacterium capitovis TaxID=131081 RepID=UPI00036BD258|nr:DUF262 domain-containing protein [Corynebacterium capitovis]WKD57795.1 hypothetical protein CAPI_06270 [Corynebacterium capitovis DSM 44611]
MGFTTASYSLSDLFARAERGELQLPDFQRDFVWDVDRIRTLVTSVLRGYPVGAFLALDTRNEPLRFQARPLHGAPDTGRSPGMLLLDGQQRLTSLYHAFGGDGLVPTLDFRGRPIERRFFVDVVAAASSTPMPVEAVFAVDRDGAVRSHFGPQLDGGIRTRNDMIVNGVVPLPYVLSEAGSDLVFDIVASSSQPTLIAAVKEFHTRVMRDISAYTIPVTRIPRETPLTGVGQIFAHANSAGVQLDVFELLTSVFAAQRPGFELATHYRQNVEDRLRRHPSLGGIGRVEFLRAMSLLVTSQSGPAMGHRGDILNLSVETYLAHVDELTGAFERAAEFLSERRIITVDQVPYSSQIVPLAAILVRVGEPEAGQPTDRLNRWFWSGVFGELYGAHAPTIRAGNDVDEVTPWVMGVTDSTPRTVEDARFAQSRLLTAGPESGVYRGIFSLIMGRGARDWRTCLPFDQDTLPKLDTTFGTVFPPGAFAGLGDNAEAAYGSVLNRTPMGIRTRVLIGDANPKRYIPRVQSKSIMEDDEFDEMLAGHLLDPALLLAGDGVGFLKSRLDALTGVIEYSMGRAADRDAGEGWLAAEEA